jgi:hypothetical protein
MTEKPGNDESPCARSVRHDARMKGMEIMRHTVLLVDTGRSLQNRKMFRSSSSCCRSGAMLTRTKGNWVNR